MEMLVPFLVKDCKINAYMTFEPGRDLYRAIPTMAQGVGFRGLILRVVNACIGNYEYDLGLSHMAIGKICK